MMEVPAIRLRQVQDLVDVTTQLCEATDTLCAEGDALCRSTRDAVVSAWLAVDRRRHLRVRDLVHEV
jgi:hypothetical protein